MKIIIILVVAALTLGFVIQMAFAGQTAGFAQYAKQGILNQLHVIYGNGIPYNVTCHEHDTFNQVTGIHDTITCTVVSK